MKTAVLSDTHNLLRPEVIEVIKECDGVIHGGDICSLKILENIKAVMKPGAPLFAVRGNCDGNLGEELPLSLEFELWGVKLFLVHNKKNIPRDVSADIVIFGHSHKYYEEIKDNRLWLNPGSCGRRRFSLPVTMAVLNIEDGKFTVEKIELSGEAAVKTPEEDLLGNIQSIMKYMEKSVSIEKISEKLRLNHKFVDEIARIMVTHPGVDAKGIMNKIEVNERNRR